MSWQVINLDEFQKMVAEALTSLALFIPQDGEASQLDWCCDKCQREDWEPDWSSYTCRTQHIPGECPVYNCEDCPHRKLLPVGQIRKKDIDKLIEDIRDAQIEMKIR